MSSARELITKSKDFDPSTIKYKEPRLNKRGGKNVGVTNAEGHALVLQFPFMFTWGVNERVDDQSGRVSYDTSISFLSTDANNPVGDFFQKLSNMQDKILTDCLENSKAWFGKARMSREVAEAMMYPILKYPKDKVTGEPDRSRPATVKLRVPFWDGKFNVELYNMKRAQIFGTSTETDHTPVDLIPSRSYMKGLMQCSGLWFAGGRCGVTWNLVQAQVRPPVRIQGFCMADDSDEEEELAKLDAADVMETAAHNPSPVEEMEETPKKKKKVVRRKKKAVV